MNINIGANFFQIFHLSLLGFNYNFSAGLQITPYFLYNESLTIRVILDFFNVRFQLNYEADNDIMVGINLIPLIIFIILNKVLRDYKKSNRALPYNGDFK